MISAWMIAVTECRGDRTAFRWVVYGAVSRLRVCSEVAAHPVLNEGNLQMTSMRAVLRVARSCVGIFVVFACSCVVTLSTAKADFATFTTSAGLMSGGQPIDASVDITTGSGFITVTLHNLEANPTSVAQNLSGLLLTFDSNVGASSLTSSSGQEVTVTSKSKGGFVLGGTVSTGWSLSSPLSTTLFLNVLGTAAGPEHTIIGAPGTGPEYSHANGSIVGNGPHNPFLYESATFNISAASVTPGTEITGAQFSFGTTAGNNAVGIPRAVPEPASLGLIGMGLASTGVVRLLRRRKATREENANAAEE